MIRLTLALTGLLAAAPAAQIHPGLLPFRAPQQNIEAPTDLFRDLQLMVGLAERPGDAKLSTDEEGREVCDNPVWLRTREVIKTKMFNMAAMFGIILRDSRHVNDRKLSAYGTFYCDDIGQIFELIAFFPGEPERAIREPAFRRAIEFIRVHWPKNKIPEEGVVVDPDYPPEPMYQLELYPYLALLTLDDPRDQAQGLWFLKELCGIRPEVHAPILQHAKTPLLDLLTSEDAIARREARAFLLAADPKHREPPADAGDAEAAGAWLDAVLYDVFPPIRRVNKGRTDLYPSKDLEQIVAVGRDVLTRKAIGGPTLGKMPNGQLYRGFEVMRLPEPLDKLRIPLGAVVTSINGTPVTTGPDIIATLETWLEHQSALLVEYVLRGKVHAMEFHLQQQ